MFRTMVFSAFGASFAVCLAVSVLQVVTTEPLILTAEEFENGAGERAAISDLPSQISASPQPGSSAELHVYDGDGPVGDNANAGDAKAWAPAGAVERTANTVLANLVVAFAVSLMLLGAMTLKGDPIDGRRGLLWGIGGFTALSLLPALGLPPELPGTPSADIVARQIWWLATAAASAGGIALIVFARHWSGKVAGIVLVVAPHFVGAPTAPSDEVAYPDALPGQFVAASLVVSALLWSFSGAAAGWLFKRLSGNGR